MGRGNDQPFERGCTWYNGGVIPNFLSPPPFYSGQPGGFNIEGKEYTFEDGSSGTGVEDHGYNTGFYVKVRSVRNNTGYNILPGQLCTFTTTYVDGITVVPWGTTVGAVTTTLAEPCYPADEFLPPAGVPQGDLFYIVVDGPCLLELDSTPGSNVATVPGQKMVSQTAAGTTGTGAGQIIPQSLSGASENANLIQNAIGRAMSQASSNATGDKILVDIGWE